MTKNIWIGLIVLVLVILAGVVEVVVLQKSYQKLAEECSQVIELCNQKSLTVTEYNNFRNKWEKLREKSELFLPHVDVYEINLRVAEGQAYVESHDYLQLTAQLQVVQELLDYVPHLMTPRLSHVI